MNLFQTDAFKIFLKSSWNLNLRPPWPSLLFNHHTRLPSRWTKGVKLRWFFSPSAEINIGLSHHLVRPCQAQTQFFSWTHKHNGTVTEQDTHLSTIGKSLKFLVYLYVSSPLNGVMGVTPPSFTMREGSHLLFHSPAGPSRKTSLAISTTLAAGAVVRELNLFFNCSLF